MGKRYYCDYCDKTMSAAPSIIRTHNNGLVHQKLVLQHYHQYKDPETILAEESTKKPCSRFPRGECQFGSICRFSHYSSQEMNELREIVAARSQSKMDTAQPSFEDLYEKLKTEKAQPPFSGNESTVLYDSNGVTHTFPWCYNTILDNVEDLPPSIKRLKIEDFQEANFTMWG